MIYNDASIKTDTCKVPDYSTTTDIIGRRVIWATIIEYPKNVKEVYAYKVIYIMPITDMDSIIYGSYIGIAKLWATGGFYDDSKNPITCKYGYLDI